MHGYAASAAVAEHRTMMMTRFSGTDKASQLLGTLLSSIVLGAFGSLANYGSKMVFVLLSIVWTIWFTKGAFPPEHLCNKLAACRQTHSQSCLSKFAANQLFATNF
jgi:hypothetical protein